MQKLSGLFLFAVLISGAFSSSLAFAQIGPIAEAAADIIPYDTHELTPQDYLNSQKKAFDAICGHSLYSYQFQTNTGCFKDVELGEMVPARDLYKTGPLKAYKTYLETGGYVDMATLKKSQEAAAEEVMEEEVMEQIEEEKEIPVEKAVDTPVEEPIKKAKKSGGWFDWLWNLFQ